MIEKTPLEEWVKNKIGVSGDQLTREQIDRYQLERLKSTIEYAKANSLFYHYLFSQIDPETIKALKDVSQIPFTSAEDIKTSGLKLVSVPQRDIHRIVTLDTSGTTDLPKRIYFTKEDQELTADFFQHGMSTFTSPKDKVLILLPGARPGSIGDLLKIGLGRMDAEGIIYGIVDDPEKVEDIILNQEINGIVGIPQQVFALSKGTKAPTIKLKNKLKFILLSTDYVSDVVVKKIENNWGCKVYEHYGMTETGLGGGVFCKAFEGYHLREADLLYEIVDPLTGSPVEDGCYGEVVFTTLTRKGMPLIRYRTGDVSRFITEPCPCGTILKRMDKIQYRIASSVTLNDHFVLTMSLMEEILFGIDGIIDFEAVVTLEDNIECLTLLVETTAFPFENEREKILNALNHSKLHELVNSKKLKIKTNQLVHKEVDIKAMKKRKISDQRRGETKETNNEMLPSQ